MRRKNWIKVLAALIIIAVFTSVTIVSIADFGDFSDDSDYGSDGGGDSYDYYGSDDSGSGSGKPMSGGALVLTLLILFTIVIVFVVLIIKSVRSAKKANKLNQNGDTDRSNIPESSPGDWNNIAEYKNLDPGFDAHLLISKLSVLYVKMQNCWSAKDLTPLRPYFTDAQYAQYDRQLDSGYRQAGLTSHIENIAVLGVTLDRWRVSGDNDEIVATVQTRLTQYTTDDKTGKLVRGSKTAKKYMTYEWTLTRKHGVTTTAGTRTMCCPHCNAPLEINKTTRCEYCGSIVTVDSVDWVISNIKGLAQRTEGR